jgi:nitrate reductase assembly molybdenum cofactor insertion protein NarJ
MDKAMNPETHLRRAQVYHYLAGAFLYPEENWLEDMPALNDILKSLEVEPPVTTPFDLSLEELQGSYRRVIGLCGSLPYETEIGVPNEFSQSQELSDIAGFYRAFGFQVGGTVRERPDYLATELEFLGLLALKQAYAAQQGNLEHEQLCSLAQSRFLEDHLGRWISLFAEAIAISASSEQAGAYQDQPYPYLARLAADFVVADAKRQGVKLNPLPLNRMAPTPPVPELSCGGCPAAS